MPVTIEVRQKVTLETVGEVIAALRENSLWGEPVFYDRKHWKREAIGKAFRRTEDGAYLVCFGVDHDGDGQMMFFDHNGELQQCYAEAKNRHLYVEVTEAELLEPFELPEEGFYE